MGTMIPILSVYDENGNRIPIPAIKGKDGADGKNGADGLGIASIEQTTKSADDDGVNIITVTLTDGSVHTFEVQNGSKGSQGTAGKNGSTPVKGTDYFTDIEKYEFGRSVIAALTTEVWTFTLEDGSTVNKSVVLG